MTRELRLARGFCGLAGRRLSQEAHREASLGGISLVPTINSKWASHFELHYNAHDI